MVGVPLELRVRVVRPGVDGWDSPDRRVGLRLSSTPLGRHGRVWQWVVDVGPGLPALTDLLASCHGFLVDDDCGRAIGVVDEVTPNDEPADAAPLLVIQGWGQRRITVSTDEVVEVAPATRRLVIGCRDGHLPKPDPAALGSTGTPPMAGLKALMARLTGRQVGRP